MLASHVHPPEPPEILVVEDSPTQAEHLKHVLSTKNYRFRTARNGVEGLVAIAERRPTLVISDIVMPEMDGYELCCRIKQDERTRDIPVILLTSLTDPVDVVKGLECGADNFVFKPYDENYLLSRITFVLAHRHLREVENTRMGVEVFFAGRTFFITSDRLQILNLLLSTYETAVARNQELSSARDQLRLLNETLEEKVRERTAALQQEVLERARAEAEVRRLNAELDLRVRQRTAELERINQELEAFSYSVSHDLRAPLRHINGFATLLQKRIAGDLDATSAHYLHQVSDACQRMSTLIDDLLEFSHVGRAELRLSLVDLDAVLREALRELEIETNGRRIDWKLSPLPAVSADAAMLRQVFANLLGNAVKYTRTREVAEITVGAESRDGELVVFVRDNGVGFDMRTATKLFGVFQRLHAASEFEGTGIGLANVRRIIARHGGRTWAESAPDQGATFYFSLPSCPRETSPPL
jgi:Bacteriophytochrome (light-regulated signal transduction histidine kinase)